MPEEHQHLRIGDVVRVPLSIHKLVAAGTADPAPDTEKKEKAKKGKSDESKVVTPSLEQRHAIGVVRAIADDVTNKNDPKVRVDLGPGFRDVESDSRNDDEESRMLWFALSQLAPVIVRGAAASKTSVLNIETNRAMSMQRHRSMTPSPSESSEKQSLVPGKGEGKASGPAGEGLPSEEASDAGAVLDLLLFRLAAPLQSLLEWHFPIRGLLLIVLSLLLLVSAHMGASLEGHANDLKAEVAVVETDITLSQRRLQQQQGKLEERLAAQRVIEDKAAAARVALASCLTDLNGATDHLSQLQTQMTQLKSESAQVKLELDTISEKLSSLPTPGAAEKSDGAEGAPKKPSKKRTKLLDEQEKQKHLAKQLETKLTDLENLLKGVKEGVAATNTTCLQKQTILDKELVLLKASKEASSEEEQRVKEAELLVNLEKKKESSLKAETTLELHDLRIVVPSTFSGLLVSTIPLIRTCFWLVCLSTPGSQLAIVQSVVIGEKMMKTFYRTNRGGILAILICIAFMTLLLSFSHWTQGGTSTLGFNPQAEGLVLSWSRAAGATLVRLTIGDVVAIGLSLVLLIVRIKGQEPVVF